MLQSPWRLLLYGAVLLHLNTLAAADAKPRCIAPDCTLIPLRSRKPHSDQTVMVHTQPHNHFKSHSPAQICLPSLSACLIVQAQVPADPLHQQPRAQAGVAHKVPRDSHDHARQIGLLTAIRPAAEGAPCRKLPRGLTSAVPTDGVGPHRPHYVVSKVGQDLVLG